MKHLIPECEIREHVLSVACDCGPRINGHGIAVHRTASGKPVARSACRLRPEAGDNSLAAREAVEQGLMSVDDYERHFGTYRPWR